MSNSVKITNTIKFIIFAAIIGAVCSAVLWLFLLLVTEGTAVIWNLIPGAIGNNIWYPIVICAVGGLIIGLFRKKYGDYPQDMMTVFGTVKKTKTYPYRKILIILIASVLPLIIGASVGPEAGMVGIIVALCCWAGENLKFAQKESSVYSEIGASVSLSILFHAPLFGIFHMEEGEENANADAKVSKSERIFIYVVAVAVALLVFKLLNAICTVSLGFPSFEEAALPENFDYLAMFLYVAAGIGLGLFFNFTEKRFEDLATKLPAVSGELIAGIVLGIVVAFLPVVQFSGEHQMGVLIANFSAFSAIGLIIVAFLKVIISNMCIQLGLKGGHFFPLIFAAVCLGYGLSLLIWPGMESHAVFAAAITTAATLGFNMKKPIAVTMLLFLCFPVRMVFWLLFAAVLASFVGGWRPGRKKDTKTDAKMS